ncbi:MAG TPA: C2H2-type zinc finger protein [Nitrososphaeraceae archaeon]|nr:C2H2-type zinc finger protein [Nitrososphaeraceae archaeon]
MSTQDTGGYKCNVCGIAFNSLSDLDAHTRENHNTHVTTT